MKLSIIIVNYNVRYFLEQCLNSILESDTDFQYEIIIVDNNSVDESFDYLKSRFQQENITFISNSENVGFAKANNHAIKKSKGEYILLLNPDTVLGENILKNVCCFMDKNKDAGAIGVKAINGLGTFLSESKRGLPTPWASFCKLSGLEAIFPKSKLFGKYSLLYLDENEVHKVPILVGAFMLLRRNALNKAGLLDEDFFMYGEDIDLSYRILKAGYQNYYLPETIIHYKGESTDMNDKKYTNAFYDAMQIFFRKHYPHYGHLFSFIIISGIKLKSFVTPLSKRKISQKAKFEIITLNRANLSYQKIIETMDSNKKTNIQFRIFDPKTQVTIGTNFVEPTN